MKRNAGALLAVSTFLAANAKKAFPVRSIVTQVGLDEKAVRHALFTLHAKGMVSPVLCQTCGCKNSFLYKFSAKAVRLGVADTLVTTNNRKG